MSETIDKEKSNEFVRKSDVGNDTSAPERDYKSKNKKKKNENNSILSRKQIGANWDSAITVQTNVTRSPRKTLINTTVRHTTVIGLDCEMVGIGQGGIKHMLARVSIVNEFGDVLLDAYVRPTNPVVDYRTNISGILPKDIETADHFSNVRRDVQRLFKGRTIIGHALHHDFMVLKLTHDESMIRDTSTQNLIKKHLNFHGQTPSLKYLAEKLLKRTIQSGEHDSVEDARAAMQIYLLFRQQWERSLQRKQRNIKSRELPVRKNFPAPELCDLIR